MVWEGWAGWRSTPSAPLYLQGQGGVVQDDVPLHHHLSLVGDLAHGCGPDHVVCLQVLLIQSICDLYRMLYFWKEKSGSRVRGSGVETLKADAKPSRCELAGNIWSPGLPEPSLPGPVGNICLLCAGCRAGARGNPGLWLDGLIGAEASSLSWKISEGKFPSKGQGKNTRTNSLPNDENSNVDNTIITNEGSQG